MQNLKEKFQNWLVGGHTKKLSPDVCIACMEAVSAWAVRKKHSKTSLWDVTEIRAFNAIRNRLSIDKIFKFSDGQNYKTFDKVGLLYSQFLKELSEELKEDIATEEESIANEVKDLQKEMTIVKAAIEVLKQKQPLTIKQIYQEIVAKGLYIFGAANPEGVVATTVKRHCKGSELSRSEQHEDFFVVVGQEDNKQLFALINNKRAEVAVIENDLRDCLEWNDNVVQGFKAFLLFQGKAEGTAMSYKSSMKWVVDNFPDLWHKAQLKGAATKGIFYFISQISEDDRFKNANITAHNQYSAALNQFLNYVNNVGGKSNLNEEMRDVQVLPNSIKASETLKELGDIFMSEYSNGFDFTATAVRLLNERVKIEITDEVIKLLKSHMFRRGDNLYFWPSAVVSDEVNVEIFTMATEWLNKYICFEMAKLYETFNQKVSGGAIRNLEDFFAYYKYINSLDVRDYCCWDYKIIAFPGTKKWQIEQQLVKNILDEINDSGGVIPEDELVDKFPNISRELIGELLKYYGHTVIKTEINDLLCYQSLDSLGLPDGFSEILTKVIAELEEIELKVTEESLHTALSLMLRVNFKAEYNLHNNKTYRQIIAAYYDGSSEKREWNRNTFSVVNGGGD